MKAASSDFASALTRSHTAVTSADAWLAGTRVAQDLAIVSGDVTLTADSLVRGSITAQVAGEGLSLLPTAPTDPLATYGQEVNVRRGVALGSGTSETLSLGWYRLNTASSLARWRWDERFKRFDATGVAVDLDGEDRMASARDFRFTSPYQPSGTVLGSIRNLLAPCGIPMGTWPLATDRAVAGVTVYEEERLDALAALAQSINAQVFIDGDGTAQVTPLPSLDNPLFTYRLGEDSSLISVGLKMTREGVYNAVVAKGEATGGQAPLLSIAQETSGPAAWGGTFGRVPYFFSSPLMTTQGQIDAGAQTRLASLISGRDIEMSISVVPDPRMEPNDSVMLDLPNATYVGRVKDVKIPLGAGGGPMSVSLRLVSSRTIIKYQGTSGLGS